jgi:phosphate acetyltransferase
MTTKPRIVFAEGGDLRTIEAVEKLLQKGACEPIVIGVPEREQSRISDATLLDTDDTALKLLQEQAAANGKTFPDVAPALVQGAAMVRDGLADGIVAGADTATDNVFRVYIKTIGLKKDSDAPFPISRASSLFLMEKSDQRLIFADCGLNPTSTPEQLAEAAYLAAEFAEQNGIDPKVAFLSFQTRGNATHPLVAPVHEAVSIARDRYNLVCDGPLQFDAAFVPDVAARKVDESDVAGAASVYMFESLEAGNIAYKIAERMGGYSATGPLFMGLNKPGYDLSRGCSVDDIVHVSEMIIASYNH